MLDMVKTYFRDSPQTMNDVLKSVLYHKMSTVNLKGLSRIFEMGV